MKTNLVLSVRRARQLLESAKSARILVLGDVMLDNFIWGNVHRISPEAPVPVVDFCRESFMPGGAANVARNLRAFHAGVELFGVTGKDAAGSQLQDLLQQQGIRCAGLLENAQRLTSVKTRIVAHQQQVVRIDRETRSPLDTDTAARLLESLRSRMKGADALIIGDYGKGVVTPALLEELKQLCRSRGVWLSLDPKPVHHLDLSQLSLITPNRKEAFELAGMPDEDHTPDPLKNAGLGKVCEVLLDRLAPAVLLITLGELGMLLCQQNKPPVHIPTVAQEVFDVSGAGDTVIASYTLAIAAGASPLEAALLANYAAGIVVGKIGTATVSPDELLAALAATGKMR